MMKRAAFVLAIALAVGGCDLFGSSTKVAHGQRYQSDDARFDPYFDSVHQQQVAAAGWPDEKKAARKPLIDTLTLPPNATDDAIVTATRTRAKSGGKLDLASAHVTPVGTGDPPLFAAVEESVRLELDRARKRRAAASQLEELAKKGEENKRTADREYENRGAEKADQKKSDQKMELRRELGAAVTAMRDLADEANRDAQSGQDFLEDIGDAIEGQPKTRPSKPLPQASPSPPMGAAPLPAEAKPSKPAKASKPSSAPASKPASAAPADKPKPPPDDVFNP